jgi:hypothetical protein
MKTRQHSVPACYLFVCYKQLFGSIWTHDLQLAVVANRAWGCITKTIDKQDDMSVEFVPARLHMRSTSIDNILRLCRALTSLW